MTRSRLEDLNLSDDQDPWEYWTDKIEQLRGTDDFEWADDTLKGIYDTICVTHRVSEGQRRAICNIVNSKEWKTGMSAHDWGLE